MTDVAVVGAGIVGAAVARELAVRGVAVTLLDRGTVSGGTTGLGEGNVLCSDKDAGPELVESTWDGDVLVGSSRERCGFDTGVDPAVGAAMVARAARLFPRLARFPVAAAWAGLRTWLPDHLPAIGRSHAVDGLWLATGHEGAGVALGPVSGRLVAQLYCGEPPAVDPAPFDPDRFF